MKIPFRFNKVSGIYKILNTNNNKSYIGSTINLYTRCNGHKSKLNRGIHHSPYLQNAYNKYSKQGFIFIILEECKPENLIIREQYYLDTFKPEYNICKIAYSNLGRKVSKQGKINISRSKKGIKRSKEASIKCSLTLKAIGHKPTDKALLKAREVCKKKVINVVTNEIYNSLKEAAEKNNLCNKQLSNKLLGKRKNNTNLKYL